MGADIGLLGRFASVGVANTVLGLLVIFACKGLLGLPDVASNLIGYGAGMVTGFALNRQWTFQHTGRALPAFVRYGLLLALAYGANLITVLGLVEQLGINSYLAQAVGILPYAVVNYLGCRFFVFSSSRPHP